MRAISTVLDVAVFLLLVSAAIGTLALAPTDEPDPVTVDDTATTLATTTAEIDYDLRGADRRAHGTVALLLGRAAVGNLTLDGHGVSTTEGFRQRVRETTLARTPDGNRTQVLVRWEPYRGAPLAGRISVGPHPPTGTDVTTATLTVPSPFEPAGLSASNVTDRGYRGVAHATAETVTDALLPDTRLEASAGERSPTAVVTAQRFQSLASVLGVDCENLLQRGAVSQAEAVVTDALADRLFRDMRDRFESPTTATRAVDTATVDIVVRRWTG